MKFPKKLTAVTKTSKRHPQRHEISCVCRLPIHDGSIDVNRWTVN